MRSRQGKGAAGFTSCYGLLGRNDFASVFGSLLDRMVTTGLLGHYPGWSFASNWARRRARVLRRAGLEKLLPLHSRLGIALSVFDSLSDFTTRTAVGVTTALFANQPRWLSFCSLAFLLPPTPIHRT